MVKCGTCGKFISATDLNTGKCASCLVTHHRACVGLPCTGPISAAWRCPTCKGKPRDIKITTTTAAGGTSLSPLVDNDAPQERDLSITDRDCAEGSNLSQELRLFIREELSLTRAEFTKELKSIRSEFMGELRSLRDDIHVFRAELAHAKSSITRCTERLDSLESKIEDLETRAQKNPDLESTVVQLQKDLNDRDQELLASDLEISNLPEKPGENLMHLTLLIATKLSVKLDERDVISASRAGVRRVRADSAGAPAQLRPRVVVVRLARPDLRDDMLRAARVRRGATTADLGVSDEQRKFYINERLTKLNRRLFHKAREAGKECNWKYVWTKRGRTFVRREQGSPAVQIGCEDDITKLRTSATK